MTKPLLSRVLAVSALLLPGHEAFAHARLTAAEPGVDATVATTVAPAS